MMSEPDQSPAPMDSKTCCCTTAARRAQVNEDPDPEVVLHQVAGEEIGEGSTWLGAEKTKAARAFC